jgi:putative oxidoreductase
VIIASVPGECVAPVKSTVTFKLQVWRRVGMAQAFLVGRVLIGCFWLYNAFKHFTNVGSLARAAGAHGVPAPELFVMFGGVLLLVGGLSLLLGLFPRIGMAAVVLFLLPVTLIMHAFWADHSAATRSMNVVNFAKNFALLGATLMFAAIPRPWPYSIERRLRMPVRASALT